MINKDHRLTADDLIITYLAEKTKQGYIPEVTEEEFMDFLKYFTAKKEVQDILWDYNQLINRFLERKNKEDWNNKTHVEFTQDGILKPNYRFSCYDETVLNSYFIPNRTNQKILDYVTEYLKKFPQRTLTISDKKTIFPKEECKLSSALLMEYLWKYYINEKIEERKYPQQCTDIIKYLIEEDLSSKIELEPVRDKYLNFYYDFARKTSILLENDSNLKIGNHASCFLAFSNYKVITSTPQNNILKTFGDPFYNRFKIDYQNLTIETTSADRAKDYDLKEEQTQIHAKKLVKAIENISKTKE